MITLILNDFKDIDPKNYDLIINNINLYNIQCTCGQKGTLIRHGYYSRTLINNNGSQYFNILRVYCKHCHKTHALLICNMVPYNQLSADVQIDMITHELNNETIQEIMDANSDNIDENRYYRVNRSFRKNWRARLKSIGISLAELIELSVSNLCLIVYRHFKCQFMQIKRGPYICFLPPT